VERIADARAFPLGTAAVEHIKRHGLAGVDLYCVFRNITFNTAIPLTAYEETVQQLDKPAGKSQVAAASPGPDTSLLRKPSAIRILLVEDDPDDVQMLKTALTKELSCEVRVAFTRGIFEAELEERPDLIVSDSNVRAFEGIKALSLARKMYPDMPFIFCSGSGSPQKREMALALGATAWIPKEPSFRELVQFIRRVLSSKP